MSKPPFIIASVHISVAFFAFRHLLQELVPDPRVSEWLFMKRLTPVVTILISYFLMVLIGPIIMKYRQAYSLRTALKGYNVIQVVVSLYLFREFAVCAMEANYSMSCQPVDFSNSPAALRMASAMWWFFFMKIVDILDTVFFILRKKTSQITFLHVYHHTSMILNMFLITKYVGGGQMFFQCMINSFIHVVMYTYYFMSAFGPKYKKYLWWKRYLTQMQLVQFCMILTHTLVGIYTPCDFPQVFNYCIIGYFIALVFLFSAFYIETYIKQDQNTALKSNSAKNVSGVGKKGIDQVDTTPVYSK